MVKRKVTEAKRKTKNEGEGMYVWRVRGSKKRIETSNVYGDKASKPSSAQLKNTNKTYESISKSLIHIWYTNTDVLTKAKIQELEEDIKRGKPPDTIAITELKPKIYVRDLAKLDYKIEGYEFEPANLEDKGSTRGVAMYIRKPLKFSKLDVGKVACTVSASIPKEIISIDINLSKNAKMIISNIYRRANSDAKET